MSLKANQAYWPELIGYKVLCKNEVRAGFLSNKFLQKIKKNIERTNLTEQPDREQSLCTRGCNFPSTSLHSLQSFLFDLSLSDRDRRDHVGAFCSTQNRFVILIFSFTGFKAEKRLEIQEFLS